ncbi:MAG: hypothetical protein AAB654_09180, partial [Acidobacteriota bacterium]
MAHRYPRDWLGGARVSLLSRVNRVDADSLCERARVECNARLGLQRTVEERQARIHAIVDVGVVVVEF